MPTCMPSQNQYSSSSIMELEHPITSSSPFEEQRNLLMRIHIFKLCIHVSGHLVSQVDVAQREEDKTNRPCGLTQHNQHSQQREVGGQASPKEEWQHDIHGGLVR